MTRPVPLAALLLVLIASTSLRADDWPQFRGPNGQGLVPGDPTLPLEWSPEKNVAWKQAIPGSGWSSPVVVNGRIYLTTAVDAGQKNALSLRVLCLDAGTGKILWNEEVFTEGPGSPSIHSKNSHASPTPLVDDNRLFVHFGHQGTACLDLDGKVVWKKRIDYPPVHGNGGSPVLVDGVLVFSCDGAREPFLIALDRKTGEQRWKVGRPGNPPKKFSFSTPLVITVAGASGPPRKQIISPGSNVVGAYDPATGAEIWRVRYVGYSVIPRPVFGQGLLFVSTSYDSPKLLAIKPDGTGDVTDTHVAWTLGRGAPHTPSPLLVGEELYLVADNGLASCLEARTGKVHWQKRVPGAYSASPLYSAGRIYLQSEDGTSTVIKAGTTFEQLARNNLGERSLASCAVVERSLLIRTDRHLYRIRD